MRGGSVFKALAAPPRRQILQELKSRELAAGEIAGRFPISGPSISRHLAILEGAGLVSQRRDANRIFYRLEPQSLARALGDFLSAICPTQIAPRRPPAPASTSWSCSAFFVPALDVGPHITSRSGRPRNVYGIPASTTRS